MVTWKLEDDCLAPRAALDITFQGKNPFLVYKNAKEILRKIFEVEMIDYWERDFRWDVSSDPREFFVRIYVNKGVDARTKILAEVVMQGAQPSDLNKDGKVRILINAKLITKFELNSVIQKSPIYKGMLWLYTKIFYGNVRRGYFRLCEDYLIRIQNDFKDVLNMQKA